ncbi:hypothetical protein D9758_006921 [Tetrapyrgos nigripes]|uniref:Uncharacterized protein n=1 Tax=Tetrapyrgos nigripes TaxID=182062 RepID=A0A8H5GSN2_9AGAR|nr:hypothetical protein D9758_006921 [Tetrapyrgos nigripes]
MSSAPPAAAIFTLENTYGSFSITKDVSAILLGCLTVQTYLYFRNFPRDAIAVKLLVLMIWALELASYAVSSRLIYTSTVLDFGNVIGLLRYPDNLSIVLWLCAASIAFMESFYIVYICDIVGRRLLTICLSLLALCITWLRCIGWLVIAIRIRRELSGFDWLLKVELASGMVVEILIAGTVGWFLRKRIVGSDTDGAERSRQWQSVEELDGPFKWVAWVVRWSLQTGALAAIVSVVNLAMNPSNANPCNESFSSPDNFPVTYLHVILFVLVVLFIGLVNVLSKVLSNCFLSSTNGRKNLQGSSDFPAYRVNSGPPDPESASRTTRNQNIESRDGPTTTTSSGNSGSNRITTALRAFIRELNLFDLASSNSPNPRVNLNEEWAGRRELGESDPERARAQSHPEMQMHMVQLQGQQQQLGQNSSTTSGPLPVTITTLATPGPAGGLPMSITRTKNRHDHRNPKPGPGPSTSTPISTSARRPPPPPPHLPQPQSESDLDLGDSGLEIEEVPREPRGVTYATVPSTSQSARTQSISTSLQVHPSSESSSSQSGPDLDPQTQNRRGNGKARRGQKLVLANTGTGSSSHTRTDTLSSALGGRTSMDSLPSYRSRATTPAPLSPTTSRPVETGALALVEKRALPLPPLPSIEQQQSHGHSVTNSEEAEDAEEDAEEPKEEEGEGKGKGKGKGKDGDGDGEEDGDRQQEEDEKGRM